MSVRSRRRVSSERNAAAHSPVVVERIEPRILMAIDVAVGTGAARSVTFTDADGTASVVRAAGGTATVTLDGPGITQTTAGNAVTVSGAAVMTNMVLTGANPGVTILTRGGDERVTLGGLNALGPVRGVSGRGVVLTGATSLSNGVGRLDFAAVQNATMTITRGAQARLQDASLSLGDVDDVSINSQQPFRLLRVNRWTDTGQSDQITTRRVNQLQSAGAFDANLSLDGNGQAVGAAVLGNARVGGPLNGDWNVAGRTGRIAVASAGDDWEATFGDLGTLAVTGDLASDVTASTIKSITAGSATGSEITLTRPFAARAVGLNRLSVRGAMSDSDIRSGADIGSVTAGSMSDSTIFAGLAPGGGDELPASAAAFVNAATIRSVTLRGPGPQPVFIDSTIAASTLGRMNLGVVNVVNGGTPMGLAAQTLGSVAFVRNDTSVPVRASRLTEPSESLDVGDFEVRIF